MNYVIEHLKLRVKHSHMKKIINKILKKNRNNQI